MAKFHLLPNHILTCVTTEENILLRKKIYAFLFCRIIKSEAFAQMCHYLLIITHQGLAQSVYRSGVVSTAGSLAFEQVCVCVSVE